MSDKMKLYTVTITREVVVVATSREQAEEEGRSLRSFDLDEPDVHAEPMRYIPGDWDRDCIPFGARGDATLGEWLDRGAAPEYRAPRRKVRP